MKEHSDLISWTLAGLLPLLILMGVYVIINGADSPGGGFQGGALLTAVFICEQMMYPDNNPSFQYMQYIEKLALIFILALAGSFFLLGLHLNEFVSNRSFILAMNLLIGVKVTCGMSIIFYRFVFYESR